MRCKAMIAAGMAAVFAAAMYFSVEGAGAAELSLIPIPEKVVVKAGEFVLTADTVIVADRGAGAIGEYLAKLVGPATGFKLKVAGAGTKQRAKKTIKLRIDPEAKSLGPEGYKLKVGASGVEISSSATAGIFHGVQTLRQLLPARIESEARVEGVKWAAPCVEITDKPRFRWRGLMLDTGRHFFPKEFVLKYIDEMALYKLNNLHLHLTEDQGWRIEIKKHPELTKIGAWRGKSTSKDLFLSPSGPAHGGFYTQEDIREIVAYAASRYVTVMPEIEMPGHSQAALASVPGLACTNQKFKVLTHWGVNKEVYCAGNEKVFEFLQDVITEVAGLFPGEYIHIGGDEVPKDRWKECPKCQARIKAERLKDENELQSYFVSRMEKFINSKGKKLIGWDEILEGGLPPRATVMSWRGISGGIEAARQGHDVVMSPTTALYFDYKQAAEGEPNVGSPLPLCRVYAFEPVPAELTPQEAAHILGAQGNLWTEHVETPEHAEYMTYPRAAALAELTWSPASAKNFGDFLARLNPLLARMDIMGVNSRKPKADEQSQCN